ncbi:alpha-amylase family protein [Ferrimonas balearica]|uniref:alpha-amylase family protein n=1 Tax=Ferrimonas balearica TaxID=44012 RepID=UPI001F17D339|nr:alpha-amylase family protein [Ferrimonas balearica]MBY6094643.1 alpha-amylase family protein [Ferrimonas balearica]
MKRFPLRPLAAALAAALVSTVGLTACSQTQAPQPQATVAEPASKAVVYQMFTRLFGNTETANVPWGTLEQNGVGKFNDITDQALEGIKELGVSHVWYTGVLHHAVVGDYSQYGISNDDPDVIKGLAGSPYAVKDYYSVNPDLAENPAERMAEFKALVERSHRHGLKAIIDIVPNHIARDYQSLGKPDGVEDFGANDDTSVEYARDNNFYYVVGQPFQVPQWLDGYQPLGGESHPLADGEFAENPAKWTGNGARAAQPHFHDWYETVKVNYGVRPDGSHDFPALPAEYAELDVTEHYLFWQGKDVPDSWEKFRDIVLFWTEFGIDGFRYDMAEMVPVAFWSYLNSHIKQVNPDAFLLAEVYQPDLYRDYLHLGKMDYLYDKVDLYDTLKAIIQGRESTDAIVPIQAAKADIEHHMLHFLENHDEQRIASPDFAGKAENALPAMVLSATLSTSPTMLYFGQDVGEPGDDDAGFGKATRTTIFDYWGVPAHQRWMNDGAFDGGALTNEEQVLRDYYVRLMQFVADSPALMGQYAEIHSANRDTAGYSDRHYSFLRWNDQQQLLVVANFDQAKESKMVLRVPAEQIARWQLADGEYALNDALSGESLSLTVRDGEGRVALTLAPLQSRILVRQ